MENEQQQTEQETTEQVPKGNNSRKIIIGIIAIIVIVIAGFLVWLYTGQISSAKEKVFNSIPLPAAIVDMKLVPAKIVLSRIDLAKQLAQLQTGTPPVDPNAIFDQLLDIKKTEALANQHNISVSQKDIDSEYQNIIKQYAAGDENGFKTELQQTYKMTPAEFQDQVIRQELLQSQLSVWFNEQKDLNQDPYKAVADIQTKLDQGQSFDDVAKSYTQDEATKDFAGDSGVIAFDDLLPEFKTGLQDSKVGDVKLVVSRYGYHLLKVLELNNDGPNGAKQIHLQQIFVKQAGFTEWLTKESDSVRTIKLLKFS